MTDDTSHPHEPFGDEDAPTADEASLLAELGAALGVDPLPDGIITRTAALNTWVGVDDELVALLSEHAEEAVGVRGGATTVDVYVTPDGELEVELEVGDGRITGTLTLGDHEVVSLVDVAGVVGRGVPIDELGRFEIVTDARGPHRLQFDGSSITRTVTEWIML